MSALNRIGIDGDALRKPLSGVGQYIFNLCCELNELLPETEFFIYTRLEIKDIAVPAARWRLRQEPNSLARKIPSFLWMKTRGAALAKKDNLDIFWAGRTIHPGLSAAREIIITVHDLNHKLVPETMQLSTRLSHKLWFDKDVLSANKIFSNSQGTSDRLLEWVGRAADKVVHPGVGKNFRPLSAIDAKKEITDLANYNIHSPYILAVSTLEPRKNMDLLIEAFVQLKAAGEILDHQLVLVGARGWQNKELAQKITDNKNLGIVLPGYVPDQLMPSIYATADMLIMPSIYEGFGMPVVEARAMGTEVIISDVPELIEASAGQAHIIQPNVMSIKNSISRLLADDTIKDNNFKIPSSWHDSAIILMNGMRNTSFDTE